MKLKLSVISGWSWVAVKARRIKIQASKLQPSREFPRTKLQVCKRTVLRGVFEACRVQSDESESKRINILGSVVSCPSSAGGGARSSGCISSHSELMRVDPSAYDHFFIFMRVSYRAKNLEAVRIHGRANRLEQGVGARRCKERFDSIPVNPTKSDYRFLFLCAPSSSLTVLR